MSNRPSGTTVNYEEFHDGLFLYADELLTRYNRRLTIDTAEFVKFIHRPTVLLNRFYKVDPDTVAYNMTATKLNANEDIAADVSDDEDVEDDTVPIGEENLDEGGDDAVDNSDHESDA